ncbi:hypothetical protein BDR07DRAFT_678319 [Suillus spraguei]|nr:hypothetical protein BDR07DRAFT_678319 [Suillus spraguei]
MVEMTPANKIQIVNRTRTHTISTPHPIMRSLVLFCIVLYLVGVLQAAPTTNTTRTTISDSCNTPSFTTRSRWTIISSSVLTLFACIYSAIHSNIPSPKDSPHEILLRRVGIMIMALLAPELMVTWAMRQWLSAWYVTRQFRESEYPNGPEAEDGHRSLLLMKRVKLVSFWHFPRVLVRCTTTKQPKFDSDSEENDFLELEVPEQYEDRFVGLRCALPRWVKRLIEAYFSKQSEDYTWTQTHSLFVLMGGFMLYVDKQPYHTLQPDEVLRLIHSGCIDAPTLTHNQIHDKSKGNAISKGLIIL